METILAKNYEERTFEDLQTMEDYLKDVKFIQDLAKVQPRQKIFELFKCLKLEKFEKGQKVIVFGEKGDKFYLILRGVCGVCLP